MVTQPAYLVALKEYARTQFGDPAMEDEILTDFNAESDRGAFILAATSIEDTLEYSIGLRMKSLEYDAPARKEVFGPRGTISTYYHKTLIAYALGIIDKRGRRDIDLVREIRNACAHSRLPLSMHKKVLANAVKGAIGQTFLSEIKNHEPDTLRIAFISHCATLAAYVATGVRRTPLETAEATLRGELLPRAPDV